MKTLGQGIGFCGFAVSLVLVATQVVQRSSAQSTKAQSSGSKSAAVEHIKLPDLPVDIPQGPNVDVFTRNCLLCHSVRYVTMQPPFSRTVWQNEVKKMITAYGAAIPEADRDKIVDYLVAIRGTPEQNSNAAAPAPGSPK